MDLSSLKVADLKQMLKAKNLSAVGNKSELIQRLEEALLREVSADVKSLSSEKEIDEEAILAGDDDPATIGKADESLLNNADLLLGDTTTTTAATNLLRSPAETKKARSVSISSNGSSSEAKVTMSSTTLPTPPSVPKPTIGGVSAISPTAAPSISKLLPDKAIVTAEQRKQIRALKFADPKVLVRAERFGVQPKELIPTEETRILQRAQRFGEVVSNKAKTLDEKERLERRKERFGAVATNNSNNNNNSTTKTSTTTTRVPITSGQNDAINKRQARFGLVTADTTINGNKRRRFAY